MSYQNDISLKLHKQKNIALIAHDGKKNVMIEWCKKNRDILSKHFLIGTGTTARMIADATGLPIKGYNSGPLGGDQQIGSRITEGKVDIFVAGIGTGGTITGVGEFLKRKNPNVKIIGVEPASSPVLSKGEAGPHKIQGIGAGFVPSILNTKIYDEIIAIENDDAFTEGKKFAVAEGILVGISSGAALKAATILAERKENENKNIVVILPDSGDRYLSTALFSSET